MKHGEANQGVLRAYLDGELDSGRLSEVEEHLKSCNVCSGELVILRSHAARVRDGLDRLPELRETDSVARSWAAFQKREGWLDRKRSQWTLWQKLSFAGGGVGIAAVVVLVLTMAPVRAWAESLLAIFRVQRFTVLDINPAALKSNGLQNNQLLNQTIGSVLSNEVTVTQSPQRPQFVADATTASRIVGFPVLLLSGETPSSLVLESGVGMNMKLDRDRIQAILDEAGRNDLQIPASVDGATVSVRVPAGVMAFYGNCGNTASRMVGTDASADQSGRENAVRSERSGEKGDATCISLLELPSPVVSAPREIDPAQIAQIALQFLGMSVNDAASFTQTVDWTSTLVLPVVRGESEYEQVNVNGNEGALLRSANQRHSDHFSLMWVDNGIVFALNGIGDDATAINLASQLQ
jgi:anti-sigma factor RsiW